MTKGKAVNSSKRDKVEKVCTIRGCSFSCLQASSELVLELSPAFTIRTQPSFLALHSLLPAPVTNIQCLASLPSPSLPALALFLLQNLDKGQRQSLLPTLFGGTITNRCHYLLCRMRKKKFAQWKMKQNCCFKAMD